MDNIEEEQDPALTADTKSKSQAKREMHALQQLGKSLVALSPLQLRQVPIPEALQDAIAEAHQIHSRGAMKRQVQYIGKIMRHLDTAPIEQVLAQFNQLHRTESARLHDAEQLRARLLTHGDAALTDVLTRFPQADRVQLRQLVRQAQKSDNVKYRRSLFRLLNDLINHEITSEQPSDSIPS